MRLPQAAVPACLLLLAGMPPPRGVRAQDVPTTALAVRITSPLGRTGLADRVRIVARVSHREGVPLHPVRFFVDDVLLGSDTDGPPYAVEWTDENPFESREIAVEVRDAEGAVARDRIRLDPMRVTEKAEVASVVLDVSVQDRNGRFVSGLGEQDFRLLEDGVPQDLDVVSPERLGATFTLLVDSSQSMARRIESVRGAAAAFVQHLRPDDRVVVAPFSRALGAVTGPTSDQQTIREAVEGIRSSGGTAILDALATIAQRLDGQEGRQAIVLLTDGHDEHSTLPPEQALAAVARLHAPLYVIGIAGSAGISLRGEQSLRSLAAATGGRAFFPARDSQYAAVNRRVAEDVQQRYLLAYTPDNQRADGAWRQLSLAVSNPEWVVRSRSGYFAPKPPPVRPSIEFTMMNTDRELLAVGAADLLVREDGVEQTLETFEEAVSPVVMVLAIDGSGSMKKAAAAVQAAAGLFVDAIRPDDRLSVATFASTVWFHHEFSTDRHASRHAIDGYVARGGTALYDALFYSFLRLRSVSARRVLVLLTDGRDENAPGTAPGSARTLDQAVELMRQAEVTVFAIGLGPGVDRGVLERLAEESGGESYFPEGVAELEGLYRRVVENLRRRYIISYTSTNPTRDGAWRSVEIVSRIPGTTVASKRGYFAPPQ